MMALVMELHEATKPPSSAALLIGPGAGEDVMAMDVVFLAATRGTAPALLDAAEKMKVRARIGSFMIDAAKCSLR